MKFLGECIGVELKDRGGPKDKHQVVNLLIEDDENWFLKASFSSSWIDEAIAQLEAARDHMRRNCDRDIVKGVQYGWKRK